MAIENIIKKIEEDGVDQSAKIIEAAKKEAGILLQEARDQAKSEQEEYLRDVKDKALIDSQAIVARARIKASEEKLTVKRKVIDSAFKTAAEKLNNLSDQEYDQAISKLLENNAYEHETVITAKDDASIKEKGFILIDQAGARRDFTFPSLIDYYRDLIEHEVFLRLNQGEGGGEKNGQ